MKNHQPLYGLILLLHLIVISGHIHAQRTIDPIFRDGDRVCFVGNSITNNGQFYNFVNLYYGTRYPERKVEFINCGISGDVTQGILDRMDSDILVHKPTWCVLMIGMNDVQRNLYDKSRIGEEGIEDKKKQALELYYKNLEIIIQQIIKSGSKLVLQKPTIYDQTGYQVTENHFGVNNALEKCGDFAQKLADKYQLPTVDYWTILSRINKVIQAEDSTQTIIGADRVHPGAVGHMIMAYEFLHSTGGDQYVSHIFIDSNTDRSNEWSRGCRVVDMTVSDGNYQFTVLENSLPFPVEEQAMDALKLVPFMEDFNQQVLELQNLKTGNYKLVIDQTDLGVFSSEQLKSGVNLALLSNSPQYQQALKIMKLYNEYRKSQSRYRNIVAIETRHLPDSLKGADRGELEDFFKNRLEKNYKTSSHYNYYAGQFKAYLTNKVNEMEIITAMAALLDDVYRANRPEPHVFKLLKWK